MEWRDCPICRKELCPYSTLCEKKYRLAEYEDIGEKVLNKITFWSSIFSISAISFLLTIGAINKYIVGIFAIGASAIAFIFFYLSYYQKNFGAMQNTGAERGYSDSSRRDHQGLGGRKTRL